jgi:hypothetical protein
MVSAVEWPLNKAIDGAVSGKKVPAKNHWFIMIFPIQVAIHWGYSPFSDTPKHHIKSHEKSPCFCG